MTSSFTREAGQQVQARENTQLYLHTRNAVGTVIAMAEPNVPATAEYIVEFPDFPKMIVHTTDIRAYVEPIESKIAKLGIDATAWQTAYRLDTFKQSAEWYFRQAIDAGIRSANQRWPYAL